MRKYYFTETLDFNNERLQVEEIQARNITEAKIMSIRKRKLKRNAFIKIYDDVNIKGFGENLLVSKNTISPYNWTKW